MRQSPRTSALARSIHGRAAAWSQETYLLADLFDAIQGGNWQRGGKPHAPKPKPFPRPNADDKREVKKYGSAPLPIDELDQWFKDREVA